MKVIKNKGFSDLYILLILACNKNNFKFQVLKQGPGFWG